MLRRLAALLVIVLALPPMLACEDLPPPEVACRQDPTCHGQP